MPVAPSPGPPCVSLIYPSLPAGVAAGAVPPSNLHRCVAHRSSKRSASRPRRFVDQ
jgi:hypothetical protein